jgi:hypothetical protein
MNAGCRPRAPTILSRHATVASASMLWSTRSARDSRVYSSSYEETIRLWFGVLARVRLFTPEGERIRDERVAYALDFLRRFGDENDTAG